MWEPNVGCRRRKNLFIILLLAAAQLSDALEIHSLSIRRINSRWKRLWRRQSDETNTPSAISIAPSQYWEGDDGPWSSFPLHLYGTIKFSRGHASCMEGPGKIRNRWILETARQEDLLNQFLRRAILSSHESIDYWSLNSSAVSHLLKCTGFFGLQVTSKLAALCCPFGS